jgi:hypothetical protein
MKKIVSIAIILISLGGGILFYWKGCSPGPSHDNEAAQLDSLQKDFAAFKSSKESEIDGLRRDTALNNRRMDSMRIRDSLLLVDLTARLKQVRLTLDSGDTAGFRMDTAAIIQNWVALRSEVREGIPVVIAKDSLSQQEIALCMEQGRVKDSIAEGWHALFLRSDSLNTRTDAAYKGLLKDYDKDQFKIKILKPIAIGGAAVILFEVVKAIIPKK